MQLHLDAEIINWAGADAFAAAVQQRGQIFRAKEGRRTLKFVYAGENYFLKLHTGVGCGELIKNWLHLRAAVTDADPEWRAINKLRDLNIPTLRAVGFGVRGFNPARRLSFLITEELTAGVNLQTLLNAWQTKPPAFALRQKLLRRVAETARRLHRNGINHRDFYLCHFFVETIPASKTAAADFRIYIMDLHRAQIRARTPQRWRVKDLGGLYFSAMHIGLNLRDRLRFMQIYSDTNLRQTLGAHKFWNRVDRRAMQMLQRNRHG